MKTANIYKFSLITLMLIMILPFILLSFYIFPSADDFSIANLVNQYGYCSYQHQMYHDWTGRFTANLIEALCPVNHLFIYRIIPVIYIILLFLSAYCFTSGLFRNYFKRNEQLLFALGLVLLILNIMPSPAESLYWFPGATEYLLANILLLFFAALLMRIFSNKHSTAILYTSAAAIIGAAIAGLNEISLFLLYPIVMLFIIISFRNKKAFIKYLIIFLIIIIVSVLEIIAPGNYKRMEGFDQTFNIMHALRGAGVSFIKLMGIHFSNPAFVILSLVIIIYFIQKFREGPVKPSFSIHPAISFILLPVIIYLSFLPGYLSMGMNPPMRVNALLSMVFILLWLLCLMNLAYRLSGSIRFADFKIHPFLINSLIIIVILLSILDMGKNPGGSYFFRGNIPKAGYTLLFKADTFKKQMKTRDEITVQAAAEAPSCLILPEITDPPEILFFTDIKKDSTHWINTHYARYHHVHSVKTSESSWNF